MYCKSKKKMIKVDIYHSMVLLVTKMSELKYIVKHNKDSITSSEAIDLIEVWDNSIGFVYHLDNGRMLMCLKDTSIGIVCHESVHLAHFIMNDVNIPISLDNTEVEAYLVEMIFDQVVKLL